jgi:CelD/BcsL family acetyltransferase involved in cellulose biosynthesis
VIAQGQGPPTLTTRAIDDPPWLAFLESQPEATVFHHPAWSLVLSDSYGYRPSVLVQTDAGGAIEAGLPVVEAASFGRRRFVSLPFTDYCPPLAATPAILARFSANLVRWRAQARSGGFTVHGALSGGSDISLAPRAVRHVLALGCSSEALWHTLNGSPVQRAVRKARSQGLAATVTKTRDDLAAFSRLHVETRRRLGVPVQPKRFFEGLWRRVLQPGLGFIVLARRAGQPIAGAVFLAWNGNLIYKFGASDPRSWELRPNNLVIWTAIEWACQRGFAQLDFGRSDLDNQGLRDFKARWGAVEVPLVYSYVGSGPPRSRSNLVMRAMATVIRRSPRSVCRMLGEMLYGRMPGLA